MLVISDNLQWGILDFLDGFGYHEFESCAIDMRANINIISAKEESKMSHINQACDQLIAKNDKKKEAETLVCQRKMKHVNKSVVDQYQLVFIVISLIKETTEQLWLNSFRHVGLDPLNCPTWDEWVDIIKPFLQGGALFNI